ncbi:MAG: type II toxin-antitoxin system VapB family antitoxin [Syntrophaceae bacterium]|nr:type II toxin-antitoxin system VapB family antitoxin [Syntrophaceae bacterium]
MRATLDIPDSLIKDLLRVTGEKKKTRAICMALDDYIRSRRKEKLLALSGKIEFDLDWQKMESMELEGMKARETHRKPR